MFNSRINLNLREVHGYTYGAFSGIQWRREAGPFVVSTAVKSDITDAAAREILSEINRIRAEAVVRDGVLAARNVTTLTLVCDHRALYGADAARFLARVAELLESPASLTL